MLGGDRLGNRLNQVYKKQLTETEILTELDGLFDQYTKERIQHETFGDFTHRKFFAVH